MSFNLATKTLLLFQSLTGLDEALDRDPVYIVRAKAEEALKFPD